MRKLFTFTLIFQLAVLVVNGQDGLFISEVADPADEYSGRFVELYNATDAAIDLSAGSYYLVRQANGGNTADVELTGTIDANSTYVIANSETDFTTFYGFAPDQATGTISGNGDDGYFLYEGGGYDTGTLVDIYGVVDEDGTGKTWEYLDSRAYRKGGITAPNTTWTASEWEIESANYADCDPGTHSTAVVVDNDPPVWETGYPKAANVADVQFDLLARLDETSMVYYVVLEDGATEPTPAEVIAGTGSAGATPVAAGSFAGGTDEATEAVTGLTVEVSYDVYVIAEDDEDTPNIQAAVSLVEVTTIVLPDVLLNVDFESGLSPFTAVDSLGDQGWNQDTYDNNGFAKISGYAGGAQDNTDYLISPAIDLDGSTGNQFSFLNAVNFSGPALEVFISTDFDGTYEVANVVAATWTDITGSFVYSSGSYEFVASGAFDLSAYSGTIYIAFKYTSTTGDGAATWEVDDFMVTGYVNAGSDATLSDLLVDGTTVEGFDAATNDYIVELPAGTATVPTVTYTTTDENATAVVTDATDLSGDQAARTTSVEVTAEDGSTTRTYSILFNPVIEVADIAALRAATDMDRKYVVTGEVVLTHKDSYRNKKYFEDATGAIEIDDNPGVITTDYAIGDAVNGLTGTIEDYFGLLQMHPTADPGAASSTGNAVEPQVITVDEFNTNFDDYEAEFVKIEGVTFADAGAAFDNGENYVVSVGGSSTVLRTAFFDVVSGTIPTMADIQGVALWHFSEAKVAPRMAGDVMAYSSDATLADLMVDGASVDGFASGTYDYAVELPFGTTEVPPVTYATSDDNAAVVLTDATDLTGDEAARTTTVEVTSQDGTSVLTYSIVFTVATTSIDQFGVEQLSVYPVPARHELFIRGLSTGEHVEVLNILGKSVWSAEAEKDNMRIDLSGFGHGVYVIRSGERTVRFIKD